MTDTLIQRIAMWSGPRNISTAMMRAWENRADTTVVDEPFYACYLTESGLQHPLRREILAAQSADRLKVIDHLTAAPVKTPVYYQKHMTQHMPESMDMRWAAGLNHCFLIRDPAEVIVSFAKKYDRINQHAIGIRRQYELYQTLTALQPDPIPVLDSNDVLRQPETLLRQLCIVLKVEFDPAMLSWPPGPRDSDGVWAPHWYQNVNQSTGFMPYQKKALELPAELKTLADQAQPYYQALYDQRLVID